jgi:hypothetical protein
MRDWTKAFRNASFKGVTFWVQREGGAGGRRVHVQHAAYGERAVTEDFGQKEYGFPSTVYVSGDAADLDMDRVLSAFRSPGAGLLILPWQRPVLAHCVDFSASRDKDRNGMIPCSVRFLEAGSTSPGGGGFLGLAGSIFSGSLSTHGVNAGISSFRHFARSVSQRF